MGCRIFCITWLNNTSLNSFQMVGVVHFLCFVILFKVSALYYSSLLLHLLYGFLEPVVLTHPLYWCRPFFSHVTYVLVNNCVRCGCLNGCIFDSIRLLVMSGCLDLIKLTLFSNTNKLWMDFIYVTILPLPSIRLAFIPASPDLSSASTVSKWSQYLYYIF